MKTENLQFFDAFRGYKKGRPGSNGSNPPLSVQNLSHSPLQCFAEALITFLGFVKSHEKRLTPVFCKLDMKVWGRKGW